MRKPIKDAARRHILVHDYFTVDLDFVWLVITEDLSPLKEQVTQYLELL